MGPFYYTHWQLLHYIQLFTALTNTITNVAHMPLTDIHVQEAQRIWT